MSLHSEWVRYGSSREYSGLAVWPERAQLPLPAVIVIQEAWGVNDHIEDVTRRFAQAGYVAFAPDLFAREGQRPPLLSRGALDDLLAFVNEAGPMVFRDMELRKAALAKLPDDQAKRMGDTMTALFGTALSQLDLYVPHVTEAAKYLRTQLPASKGRKIASVGFCMGGSVSALLACHDPELAGAAVFYGGAPPDDQMPKINCPVIAFHGSTDARLITALPAFQEAMKKHGKSLETHVYEGAQHAFFNDIRPSYNSDAVRDSFARVLEFFRRVTA
jgi:carboxymethylenebutenolidase